MFIEMEHAPVAYADAFETAVAVKEAMVVDGDGGFGVLDKTAVYLEPHALPLCALHCAGSAPWACESNSD